MNTDDYISSGILQAYALGRLSAGECADVEQKLTAHPELHGLLLQIKGGPKEQSATAFRPKSRPPEKSGTSLPVQAYVRKLDPEKSIRFWRIATAAAVTLAMITTWFAVTSQASLKQSQIAFREMLVRTLELSEEVRLAGDPVNRGEGTSPVHNNPAYTHIVLYNLRSQVTAELSLFWNQRSNEVFLQVGQVPGEMLDGDFQLWAIRDGEPVDAGIFRMTPGSVKMPSVERATAFMVTHQPKSGEGIFDPTRVILFGKAGR